METRDHGFKYAFENDPRGMLHITGRLPISAEARVEVLGTALPAPGKLADSLVLVRAKSGTWLDQTEALSWWRSRERLAVTRRALTGALIPKYYRYKLYPSILLMLEEGMPKTLPEVVHYDRGGAFGGIKKAGKKVSKQAAKRAESKPWSAFVERSAPSWKPTSRNYRPTPRSTGSPRWIAPAKR